LSCPCFLLLLYCFLSFFLPSFLPSYLSICLSSIFLFVFLSFLEPTTGMDPVSKRLTWEVIKQLSPDKAIILTSHHTAECEALCTRIGIMTQGRFVCLGSQQHLKSRFAKGYTVQIKPKNNNSALVEQQVHLHFPAARLTEIRDDMMVYQVPRESCKIASVFDVLMGLEETVQDFYVWQTTLDQVFLTVAKEIHHHHHDDDDEGEIHDTGHEHLLQS